jgi:hypothetical protein
LRSIVCATLQQPVSIQTRISGDFLLINTKTRKWRSRQTWNAISKGFRQRKKEEVDNPFATIDDKLENKRRMTFMSLFCRLHQFSRLWNWFDSSWNCFEPFPTTLNSFSTFSDYFSTPTTKLTDNLGKLFLFTANLFSRKFCSFHECSFSSLCKKHFSIQRFSIHVFILHNGEISWGFESIFWLNGVSAWRMNQIKINKHFELGNYWLRAVLPLPSIVCWSQINRRWMKFTQKTRK